MTTLVTSTGEHLVSIDEYLKRQDSAVPSELVRGRIISMNPPYPYHGYVCANVLGILRQYAMEHDAGYVLGNDSGVITERDPDTLRGADVAFYSYSRLPKGSLSKRGYLDVAPDVIFEVRSSLEPWKDVLSKVAEYLRAGVRIVCVLDTDRSTATAYYPDRPEEQLDPTQSLSLPGVLPGFNVGVHRFFD